MLKVAGRLELREPAAGERPPSPSANLNEGQL